MIAWSVLGPRREFSPPHFNRLMAQRTGGRGGLRARRAAPSHVCNRPERIGDRVGVLERGEPLAQSAQLSGGAPAAGVLTEELSFLSQILGREMLSEAAGTPVSLMKPDGEAQT